MFIHDLIKINFIREGYLPNYPYHLISTEEMCNGFYWYFKTHYPQPTVRRSYDDITSAWNTLYKTIVLYVQGMKYDENFQIPDWVYSYMLGAVIGPKSDTLDIHDLILPIDVDNIDDEFGIEQEMACYEISKRWILQTKQNTTLEITEDYMEKYHLPAALFRAGQSVPLRPPTIFGEPHVIKSVRLSQLSI